MGSSESKMTAHEEKKAEQPAVKKTQVSHLIDPRSPSTGIDRTPIQFDRVSKIPAEVQTECLPAFSDPRSPSTGITRTPVREVMRATVGSFARRLGMIFHQEANVKVAEGSVKYISEFLDDGKVVKGEELAATEPLLTQLPENYGALTEQAKLPVTPGVQTLDDFVLFEEPQVEVVIEAEADLALDDAEEAKESPLHKRLSMSLIAYNEGETSSSVFAEVHRESASSPEPSVDVGLLGDGLDHCYALPSVAAEPECPASPSVVTDFPTQVSPVQPEEPGKLSSSEVTEEPVNVSPSPPETSPAEPPAVSTPELPQVCTGIRCPSFDSKSPSQVVFKPQWLGKGFGATGMRAKGVQGHRGKGSSSPLAVRVAVKNATNENKVQSGKRKQKGTEGRSPLQILKETNSPRDQRSQMKVKVSTPDKQRLGQTERRVLAVSLDKENR